MRNAPDRLSCPEHVCSSANELFPSLSSVGVRSESIVLGREYTHPQETRTSGNLTRGSDCLCLSGADRMSLNYGTGSAFLCGLGFATPPKTQEGHGATPRCQ